MGNSVEAGREFLRRQQRHRTVARRQSRADCALMIRSRWPERVQYTTG